MFKTKNLISVGIMIGLVSTSALAQEEEVEEVVVTGTRITTDGFESVSPVEVVTIEEIDVTGLVRIEDVLNQFPQIEKQVGVKPYSGTAYPKVNVYEYDDKVGVIAEIPGLDKKDLTIDV